MLWLGIVLARAAPAQARTQGQVLLEGVARVGLPVAVYSPDGHRWEGEWGTARVQVSGNAGLFVWPGTGEPRLEGPGAPPPEAFRPCDPARAVVGVLAGAARRLEEPRLRESVERALRRALGRSIRTVSLGREVGALLPAVWLALDLVVAGDEAELDRAPGARDWIRLGGQALVLESRHGRQVGQGRIRGMTADGRIEGPGPWDAFAAIRPPRPDLPPHSPQGPSRVWPALAMVVYLAGLAWALGSRRRIRFAGRAAGVIGSLLVGASVFWIFSGDYWCVRSGRTVWCFPGPDRDAWFHAAEQVWTRGRGPARVRLAEPGRLFTHVPAGAYARAMPGHSEVTWAGSGWVSTVGTRRLGEGLHVRRTGSRTLLSLRLPPGYALEPAWWIAGGEVRPLPGVARAQVHDLAGYPAARKSDLPEDLRSLLSMLDEADSSGVLVGELQGPDLTGRHLAYALP